MHILHTVYYYPLDSFNIFELTHDWYCVSLNKDVAISQQLQGFKCHTVRTDEALSSFHKFLSIPNDTSYFYDFTKHFVVSQDFDSLLIGNWTSEQFDQISCSYDAVWIPSLSSCLHTHRTFYGV